MDKSYESGFAEIIEQADLTYKEYINSMSEKPLTKLAELLNPWLYELIFAVVQNEDKAEEIIIKAWEELLSNKKNINISKRHIAYELFLMSKNQEIFWK